MLPWLRDAEGRLSKKWVEECRSEKTHSQCGRTHRWIFPCLAIYNNISVLTCPHIVPSEFSTCSQRSLFTLMWLVSEEEWPGLGSGGGSQGGGKGGGGGGGALEIKETKLRNSVLVGEMPFCFFFTLHTHAAWHQLYFYVIFLLLGALLQSRRYLF